MLDNLTQRLARVMKTLRGEALLTEANITDALREVRLALLEADVALPAVKSFIASVKEKAVGEEVIGSLSPGQALIGVVHRELTALMGEAHSGLNLATQPPAIVLMAGLQGAGQTTTVGKLAKLLVEKQKKKVLVVSCDVYRPAAIEQLKTVAAQAGADCFPSAVGEKPVDIARNAVDWAKKHYHDVLLVDTAGRLAIDEAMMREITELHAAIHPIETLFVVDAMLGQDAINTAKAFGEALPLTGVVLTKLDGDSRGGAALSVRHVTGKPIKYAGVGEKLSGIEPFHPERMASRILGMGDVLSLIEEAQKGIDAQQAVDLAKKLKSGKGFDLNDFKEQIGQMRKLGGITSMMAKLPAQFAQAASHDLQEPLRKILLFSSRLQAADKGQLSEQSRVNLHKIGEAAQRMSQLISDLLDYSRLTHHAGLLRQTDLNATLDTVVADLEVPIGEKNATVTYDNLPTLGAIPFQLNQLFYNLLSNALKFSKDGVPPIITITSRVLAQAEATDLFPVSESGDAPTYVELRVKDNGIGFDQKYGEKIFMIFQRLHRMNQYAGSGIGLALCRKIVEFHHGKISALAHENDGAEFRIILPLAQPKGHQHLPLSQ